MNTKKEQTANINTEKDTLIENQKDTGVVCEIKIDTQPEETAMVAKEANEQTHIFLFIFCGIFLAIGLLIGLLTDCYGYDANSGDKDGILVSGLRQVTPPLSLTVTLNNEPVNYDKKDLNLFLNKSVTSGMEEYANLLLTEQFYKDVKIPEPEMRKIVDKFILEQFGSKDAFYHYVAEVGDSKEVAERYLMVTALEEKSLAELVNTLSTSTEEVEKAYLENSSEYNIAEIKVFKFEDADSADKFFKEYETTWSGQLQLEDTQDGITDLENKFNIMEQQFDLVPITENQFNLDLTDESEGKLYRSISNGVECVILIGQVKNTLEESIDKIKMELYGQEAFNTLNDKFTKFTEQTKIVIE